MSYQSYASQDHRSSFYDCSSDDTSTTSSGSGDNGESGDNAGALIVSHVLGLNVGVSTPHDGLVAVEASLDPDIDLGQHLSSASESEGASDRPDLLSIEIGSHAQGESQSGAFAVADIAVTNGECATPAVAVDVDAGGAGDHGYLLRANLAPDIPTITADVNHDGLQVDADDVLAAMIGTQDVGVPLLGESLAHEADAWSGAPDLSGIDVGTILGGLDLSECLAA